MTQRIVGWIGVVLIAVGIGVGAAVDPDTVVQLVIVAFAIAVYMLPTIAAWRKPQRPSIAVINVLLGWTLIGWVVALAWAVYPQRKELV